MSYKFQRGPAVMSGSLIQEGALEATSISSSGNLSGSANLLLGGTVRLDGVVDADLDVSADSFYYHDGDKLMKRDTMADYATAIAGTGIGASSGVLSVDLQELSEVAIAAGDFIAFTDTTDSNKSRKETIDDVATLFAGTGLAASSAVLSVDLQELSEVAIAAGDFIAFTDTTDSNKSRKETIDDVAALFAGAGLAASSAVIAVANATNGGLAINANDIQVSLVDLAAATIDVAADSFAIIDADDSDGSKKESIADLMTAVAGVGLAAASGVLAVDLNELGAAAIASGDSLAFVDNDDSNASKKETVDDLATLFAGDGLSASSAVMALDLNELTAAAIDVAADSFAIIDANDSNKSRKESIADLATAMAGAGITATDGVFSVAASSAVAGIGDADATLAEGYNYGTAQLSADRTWTMPASAGMSVGDRVIAKAPMDVNGQKIIITRAGSQTIDGFTAGIELESDGAALTMVYAAADTWIIV